MTRTSSTTTGLGNCTRSRLSSSATSWEKVSKKSSWRGPWEEEEEEDSPVAGIASPAAVAAEDAGGMAAVPLLSSEAVAARTPLEAARGDEEEAVVAVMAAEAAAEVVGLPSSEDEDRRIRRWRPGAVTSLAPWRAWPWRSMAKCWSCLSFPAALRSKTRPALEARTGTGMASPWLKD